MNLEMLKFYMLLATATIVASKAINELNTPTSYQEKIDLNEINKEFDREPSENCSTDYKILIQQLYNRTFQDVNLLTTKIDNVVDVNINATFQKVQDQVGQIKGIVANEIIKLMNQYESSLSIVINKVNEEIGSLLESPLDKTIDSTRRPVEESAALAVDLINKLNKCADNSESICEISTILAPCIPKSIVTRQFIFNLVDHVASSIKYMQTMPDRLYECADEVFFHAPKCLKTLKSDVIAEISTLKVIFENDRNQLQFDFANEGLVISECLRDKVVAVAEKYKNHGVDVATCLS